MSNCESHKAVLPPSFLAPNLLFHNPQCLSALSSSLPTMIASSNFSRKVWQKRDRFDVKISYVGIEPGAVFEAQMMARRIWLMFYRNLQTGNSVVSITSNTPSSCPSRKIRCTAEMLRRYSSKERIRVGGFEEEIFSFEVPQYRRARCRITGNVSATSVFLPGYSIIDLTPVGCFSKLSNFIVKIEIEQPTSTCKLTEMQIVAFLVDL